MGAVPGTAISHMHIWRHVGAQGIAHAEVLHHHCCICNEGNKRWYIVHMFRHFEVILKYGKVANDARVLVVEASIQGIFSDVLVSFTKFALLKDDCEFLANFRSSPRQSKTHTQIQQHKCPVLSKSGGSLDHAVSQALLCMT